MKYQHRFRIYAPLATVNEFHRQSASMGAITPPPLLTTVHSAPARLGEGDEMDFTLQVGPFGIPWLARIEDVTSSGFTDRQLRGPFRTWVHRHTFIPINTWTTEIVDEVEAELRPEPLWKLLGLGMWLSLPVLFAYRGQKTRQLLEKSGQAALAALEPDWLRPALLVVGLCVLWLILKRLRYRNESK